MNPLEMIKVAVEPATKLIDCISKACGKVYEPYYIKKIAKAKAFEIDTISDAIKRNSELNVKYNNGEIGIDELNIKVYNRLYVQELTKQINLETIFDLAYTLLKNEKDCEQIPVSQTWINKFIEYSATVSDEEMQILWAKILAGEVKKPNSYSLRTLLTLSNLSKDEAKTFQKICDLVIKTEKRMFIQKDDKYLESKNIKYEDLIKLCEAGLLSPLFSNTITIEIPIEESMVIRNRNYAVVANSNVNVPKELAIGCYILTSVGIDLYKIIDFEKSDESIIHFAKKIKKQNKQIDIKVYKILKLKDDGTIDCDEEDILEQNA